MPIGVNVTRIAEDYVAFFVLSTLPVDPATNRFAHSGAAFAVKTLVATRTLDGFATDSDVMPATAAAAAQVAAVAADLAANPLATVRIEGFTDSTGTVAHKLDLGGRRAASGTAALGAAGVDPGRIHEVARGETGFVAPNDTPANLARNRRVVFTVTRPGP